MSKYYRLKDFLSEQDQDRIPMTFAEIEKVLEFELPASKQYPAWWSNNPSNNPMTREWLDAGYETESVNTASGKLVFRRVKRGRDGGGSRGAPVSAASRQSSPRPRHPGFGFMKGMITIEKGFDVTKPFDDQPWDQGYLGEVDRK
ncbi:MULTISPECIES: hypothetical protein [unclassified Mesorhizobium]|uniref:DUF7662 domain-containing protein n=1 Tax=unclassified Mesorhizobium TaxID=325217 RepID=UPI001128E3BE|nr:MULTISPECIES: hypothetical protein [unclassified Mesorhizobium]MCA0057365.1 hypothetical protein [Mesorhizobium sp. B261B1A]TPL07738.1 hypothetical protein FJ944_19605 [Mesorhizobium sp. B2-4-11]TPL15369.1 hypothetical protein FJ952_20280 [Mesorhizobium sp. B2-4-10]TPM21279.1 hypothetical protein FJ953_11540 [Mesorhizobium sp. B2-3-6]TPN63097.1 hypothetical protein FJ986_24775 [Mesorhizobium sp. B1-1-1]